MDCRGIIRDYLGMIWIYMDCREVLFGIIWIIFWAYKKMMVEMIIIHL
jgi:hypothetical protein